MLGRALEALCRDILAPEIDSSTTTAATPARPNPKNIKLGEGIKRLKEKKVIDDRLYDWSQQLQAFRNLAAHSEDISISREDAEDLQTFVNAIVEYITILLTAMKSLKTVSTLVQSVRSPNASFQRTTLGRAADPGVLD